MEITPFTASRLPLKNLKWDELVSLIGQARAALGSFDERLKKINRQKITSLKKKECLSTVVGKSSQKILLAQQGLDFAIEWAKTKPLNLEFLCRVHAIVKKDGPNPKEIGRFRERQNWIGPEGGTIEDAYFFPPEAKRVPAHMQALFRYLKGKEKDPLVKLAIFFAQILIIHPFMDGNGRVARIFIPIWLWKQRLILFPALFLSSYFEDNRLQYNRKLFEITQNNDWEDWIKFFLKGIIEACRAI